MGRNRRGRHARTEPPGLAALQGELLAEAVEPVAPLLDLMRADPAEVLEPPAPRSASALAPTPAAPPPVLPSPVSAFIVASIESERAPNPPGPAAPDGIAELIALAAEQGALGRYDDAEREFRRAQRLAPDNPDVRAGLGILAFRRGLYDQAEAELEWVCAHAPEHGPAHFYRGEALNRLGRVDEALAALERAAHLQPDSYRAYYLMGILFDRKNLREEAAAMYRRARELQPR